MKRPKWLKKPETALGMVATGVIGVAVLAAGTGSVFALVSTTQNTPKVADSAQKTQESAVLDENTADSATNDTTQADNSQSSVNSATTPTNTASASDSSTQAATNTPAAPVTPTYTDTYPANWKNNPGQIDTWGMTTDQSTSYTAWKVNEAFGDMPKWGIGRSVSGDAQNWPTLADQDNIPRGTTAKLHSVGIRGNWSVWVEAVHDDGTIDISFYNQNNSLAYGTQLNVKASAFSTFIYFQ